MAITSALSDGARRSVIPGALVTLMLPTSAAIDVTGGSVSEAVTGAYVLIGMGVSVAGGKVDLLIGIGVNVGGASVDVGSTASVGIDSGGCDVQAANRTSARISSPIRARVITYGERARRATCR